LKYLHHSEQTLAINSKFQRAASAFLSHPWTWLSRARLFFALPKLKKESASKVLRRDLPDTAKN
jgi:hypothetical protein